MMGGALGVAVLASIAASRTNHLLAAGAAHLSALVGGYRVAFIIGAAFAAAAATVSAQMLRTRAMEAAEEAVSAASAREPAFADADL